MSIAAKICGIRDELALSAAIEGGAAAVGFVLYPPSKNAITATEAHKLAIRTPMYVLKVGLIVDATDDDIRAITDEVRLDLLQLHGVETPARVAEIRQTTGVAVMKALRVQDEKSFAAVKDYEAVADRLLFDSRIGNESSGGPIPWSLLKGKTFSKPWMLAGGLTAQNLGEAVKQSSATMVDVSSGVEDSPGHKSTTKISQFLAVAAGL